MATQKFKWQTVVSKYAYPETWRSVWQVLNSLVPFIVMWYLMYRSLAVGYWLTLMLAVPAPRFSVAWTLVTVVLPMLQTRAPTGNWLGPLVTSLLSRPSCLGS